MTVGVTVSICPNIHKHVSYSQYWLLKLTLVPNWKLYITLFVRPSFMSSESSLGLTMTSKCIIPKTSDAVHQTLDKNFKSFRILLRQSTDTSCTRETSRSVFREIYIQEQFLRCQILRCVAQKKNCWLNEYMNILKLHVIHFHFIETWKFIKRVTLGL